jgi:hypothetical protein
VEKIKVKLTRDLSQYNSMLKIGTEGYTVEASGMWSRSNDNFVSVFFPGIETRDIMWSSLEIIDEDFIATREKEKQAEREALVKAYDVVKTVGPKGGFRSISYCYLDSNGKVRHASKGNKADAEAIEKMLVDLNIAIRVEKEKS